MEGAEGALPQRHQPPQQVDVQAVHRSRAIRSGKIQTKAKEMADA